MIHTSINSLTPCIKQCVYHKKVVPFRPRKVGLQRILVRAETDKKEQTPAKGSDAIDKAAGSDAIDKAADAAGALANPLIQNLGFSGGMGLVTAITLKTLGQLVATVVGIFFIGVQALAYLGFIDVNWAKIQEKMSTTVDLTGDGKFDVEDVKAAAKQTLTLTSFGVPSVAGFVAGFLMGFKIF